MAIHAVSSQGSTGLREGVRLARYKPPEDLRRGMPRPPWLSAQDAYREVDLGPPQRQEVSDDDDSLEAGNDTRRYAGPPQGDDVTAASRRRPQVPHRQPVGAAVQRPVAPTSAATQ